MIPFIRSNYNYDVEAASAETAIDPGGPSLTVQSMAEDADLNVLMKRFGVTGKMPENVRLPSYGDFSHVSDYRSAIEAAHAAEDSFMQFPADIRALFDNNPQMFLEFVENPANIEQTKKWFPKENLDGNSVSRNDGARAGASGQGAPQGTSSFQSGGSQAGGNQSGNQSGT